MAIYRLSRNVEASIIDKLVADLASDSWSGISVLKGFPKEYKNKPPFIGVEALERPIKRKELGTDSIYNDIIITLRIFSTSDGQRLDLADWIIPKFMEGINYYVYTITNGVVSLKTLSGKINIMEISENRKELTNTENLSKEDRYRHLIILSCRVAT